MIDSLIIHDTGQLPGTRHAGFYNGQPVFEETRKVKKRVPKLDERGKQMLHPEVHGVRKPMTELKVVGEETREFIRLPLGNGQVVKNYNFRPSEQEQAHAEAVAATRPEVLAAELAAMRETLERVKEATGLSDEDLKPTGK
jgi:hypothetical protein